MDFMEIDLILRLSTRYQVINFGELVDYAFYHLGHGRPGVSRDVSRDDRKANPWHKVDDMPASFCPNGDDWGLERYGLELQPAATAQSARASRRLLHGATFAGLSFLSAALTLFDRSIAFARRAIRAVGRRSKRLALRVVQGVGLQAVFWLVPPAAFALM
jgi:hypothetical protein